MRLIDADSLKPKVEEMVVHRMNESDYDFGRNQAFDYVADILIDDEPTADAVEVVRCKDCKWHLNGHLCKQLSQYGSIETPPSFYCGFGERRGS